MFELQSQKESGQWVTIKADDSFDTIYDWFIYSVNNAAPSANGYRMTEGTNVITEWTR